MAAPSKAPDRNLALELVRVTEAAAMAAGRWIGRGDKIAADQAAVDAMRTVMDTVSMAGCVVIGEGEKDEAPMLYNGEEIGNGQGPEVDVAVDPLEGTRLTALGMPNAITTVALAERGTMYFPGAAVYMDKIATGPESADAVSIDASTDGQRPCGRERERRLGQRGLGRRPRPAEARGARRGATGGRRQGDADHRRRRRTGDRRGAARHRRRRAHGHRRHARGRPLGGGAQVRRRRDPGQALAADGRRAPEPRRRRLRPRQAC